MAGSGGGVPRGAAPGIRESCQPRQAGELCWSGPQADGDAGILLGPCPLVHALRALGWPSVTSCEETM